MPGYKARPIEMSVKIFDVAQRMFEAGRIQIEFRKQWTDGTGQKLFALFECNKRFPDVNLAARVREGLQIWGKFSYEGDGPIAYEALDKEPLRKIAHGTHRVYKGAAGLEAYVRKAMR